MAKMYRGKRLDNGKWIYGWLHLWRNGQVFINIEEDGWAVDPATVGQSTGLKDKNGKEIYEGDIVKENSKRECLSIIKFEQGCFMLKDSKSSNSYHPAQYCGVKEKTNMLYMQEIIGNVHDKQEDNE